MKNNSCVLQSKSSGRMAADSIEHPRSVPAGRGFCFQGFQSLRHPLSKAVRGRMLDDDQLPTWKCPVRHTIRIRGLFAGDFKSRGQEFWGAPVDKKRNIRRTLCGAQALQCPICFCQRDVRGASWRCTRPVLSPLGPFPPPTQPLGGSAFRHQAGTSACWPEANAKERPEADLQRVRLSDRRTSTTAVPSRGKWRCRARTADPPHCVATAGSGLTS